jgi:hypothetical protein
MALMAEVVSLRAEVEELRTLIAMGPTQLPDASGIQRGAVNTSPQIIAGAKTFNDDVTIAAAKSLKVGTNAVIGARKTGWTAATGTATRTTFATHAAQTISAIPTQAEVQAIDDDLVKVSQRLMAIIEDLISHGTIGA